MKLQKILLLLAVVTSITLFSFNTLSKKSEKVTSDKTLEEKKEIIKKFYTDLIENEIDKQFENKKYDEISEKEIIESFLLRLPEYGCVYKSSNCTGKALCGASRLYASTFGYNSFSGENGGGCEEVK